LQFVGGSLDNYLNKWGFKKEKDYIITFPIENNLEFKNLQNDLNFSNRMAVTLENIVKANAQFTNYDK